MNDNDINGQIQFRSSSSLRFILALCLILALHLALRLALRLVLRLALRLAFPILRSHSWFPVLSSSGLFLSLIFRFKGRRIFRSTRDRVDLLDIFTIQLIFFKPSVDLGPMLCIVESTVETEIELGALR